MKNSKGLKVPYSCEIFGRKRRSTTGLCSESIRVRARLCYPNPHKGSIFLAVLVAETPAFSSHHTTGAFHPSRPYLGRAAYLSLNASCDFDRRPRMTKMRLFTLASAVLAASAFVSADPQTAQVYIQAVGSSSAPVPLAEITYDITTPETATSVTSYEAPELPESASLVRIGLYDSRAKKWTGSTSVASVENFGKGYSPHFLLSVDATKAAGTGTEGEGVTVLGASLRGVRIDAGQTRDFGPQAKLVMTGRGKQPELNKPVVLSPEGKKVEKEEEKTFLQKFVWRSLPVIGVILICAHANMPSQVLVDDWNCAFPRPQRRRRRRRGQVESYDNAMRSHIARTRSSELVRH